MRWLYHALRTADLPRRGGSYAPASLPREGFIHASYRDDVRASAALYLPRDEPLALLRFDPRRLGVAVDRAATPRGEMPHVPGAVPDDAWLEIGWDALPLEGDRVEGTRWGVLVAPDARPAEVDAVRGPLEQLTALERGGDGTVALIGADGEALARAPSSEAFDVIVCLGGEGRLRGADAECAAGWLASFPATRMVAAIAGGRRLLEALAPQPDPPPDAAPDRSDARSDLRVSATRVVGDAPGCGREVALALVRWVAGDDIADAVARSSAPR